tara:strand:+ start:2276 stop:2731 length:456 start_codon:yes stop_codon:yes gene_type:complete
MSLKSQIMISLKEAMRAKDKISLETLRAVKSELLKMETATNAPIEVSQSEEIKLLQKMQKQRKDAAAIYSEQGREELASLEIEQSNVLDKFLPQQLSREALTLVILQIIEKVGATGPSDIGKVMGVSSKELAGKADGRMIADVVKAELNSK